ncbi:MAG TPA: hypothetical protein VN033_05920 [Vulgatibacter sp.]|nr:hypothetical protein [Vulgatibacter sp.]
MILRPKLAILLLAGAVALGSACGGEDPPVALDDDPEILEFRADPDAVIPGEATTLSWKTRNVRSIRIVGSGGAELNLSGVDPAEGSVSDKPAATTTYVLIASNAIKEVEKRVVVSIRGDSPTAEIDAEETLIDVGSSTILSWNTTNATRVSLTANGDPVDIGKQLTGTLEVTPSRTTEYELTAIGAGTDTARVTVEVAPIIEVFELVTAGRPEPRTRAELTWKTVGADDLVLTGGPGFSVEPILPSERNEGKRRFTVPDDGKVFLEATRGPTSVTRELPLELRGVPVIVKAVAIPEYITLGEETNVRFEWTVEDVDSIELETTPGGKISTFGKNNSDDFIELEGLTTSTVITFTAKNKVGSTVAEALVRAVPRATIKSFRALPARVAANEEVQIAWDVTGATLVEIFRGDEKLEIDGTKATGTTTDRVTADTEYRLRAVNEAGAEAISTVQVTIGAPEIDSFDKVQGNVVPGGKFDLAWKVRGGRSLEVKGPGGSSIAACATSSLTQIADGGCEVIAPATPGDPSYELVVSGSGGARATETLVVPVSDGPWVKALTASEELLSVGANVTLAWNVENDTQDRQPTLHLEDDLGNEISLAGRNPNFGTVSVPLTVDGVRTFTLTAETPGTRPSTATVSVTVLPLAAVSLTATPSPFNPADGVPLKLMWDTQGADSIELFQLDADGTPRLLLKLTSTSSPDAPARIARGEYVVPQPPARTPVVYLARVLNELFAPNTAEVSVPILLPTITSFDASARAPDGTVTLNWVTSGGKVSIDAIHSAGCAAGCPYVEVSTAAPYLDIHAEGNASMVPLTQCGTTSAAGEDGCGDFSLGFDFPFQGQAHGSIRAFVNGFLSFDLGSFPPLNGQKTGFVIGPAKSYANIVPYWHDLKLGTPPSGMYYETRNDPVWGDYTVIQWKNVLSNTSTLGFEAVLFEDGSYDLRYGDMSSLKTGVRGWQSPAGTSVFLLDNAKIGSTLTLDNRSFRRVVNAPSVGSLQVDARTAITYRIKVESPLGSPTQQVVVPAP